MSMVFDISVPNLVAETTKGDPSYPQQLAGLDSELQYVLAKTGKTFPELLKAVAIR